MQNNQENKIYERAIKLLSIRMHTTYDLERKLKLRGFSPSEIRAVIERLQEERLLNDDLVADSYIESLIRHKTFGYYGILSKMKQKGIASDLAQRLVEEKLSLEVEQKIAEKALGKIKERGAKAAASLKRKGFRTQVIMKLIDFREIN